LHDVARRVPARLAERCRLLIDDMNSVAGELDSLDRRRLE
jgi:hypothetical protein